MYLYFHWKTSSDNLLNNYAEEVILEVNRSYFRVIFILNGSNIRVFSIATGSNIREYEKIVQKQC